MITRAVPAIKGSGDPAGYDVQGRLRPPEDVLRQARATSITGVLGQIGSCWLEIPAVVLAGVNHCSSLGTHLSEASVASYALEILQELKQETTDVQDRMTKLHQRVDVLAEVVDGQIRQTSGRKAGADLLHLLPTQEESDRVLCIQTISASSSGGATGKTDRPSSVAEAYERCEGVPPLELLDRFYASELRATHGSQADNHHVGSGVHGSSISRKKYSNPGFFMEEWLKNEEGRQQRALEIKEERRRERRDAQSLRKARELDQQRHTTSTEEAKSAGRTDDTEQKIKFLKIRSWREIYGTGECKELMKPQQSGRSPSLRDLRKKANQSLASITQSSSRSEEHQQPVSPSPPPPPLPTSQGEVAHTRQQSLTNEQVAMLTPADLPSIPTSLGGAFMQEMDDDEIAMEMQLEDEFTNGIPPPPPPDSTNPEEFTDHGLSYYYDPAARHNLTPPPPPPPPPPELDEQSRSDAYYDAYEQEDDGILPPPPIEEFQPPPPPPPPPEPRPFSLLEEIQLGAALRSVTARQPAHDAPVLPQAALLQQILQKQSRHLRPVEPRRPPLQTRHSTGAPFADSIARILERRAMIAYDSDSDKSSDNQSNDDW